MSSRLFTPGYSRAHFYTLLFTHLFAWSCICLMSTMIIDGLCAIVIGLSFCYFLQDKKVQSLEHVRGTEWMLVFEVGGVIEATLLPSSVMMPYFVVMHFQAAQSHRQIRCFFFRDHFPSTDYIALRRSMKMGYL